VLSSLSNANFGLFVVAALTYLPLFSDTRRISHHHGDRRIIIRLSLVTATVSDDNAKQSLYFLATGRAPLCIRSKDAGRRRRAALSRATRMIMDKTRGYVDR
jgi:hypothetical protein